MLSTKFNSDKVYNYIYSNNHSRFSFSKVCKIYPQDFNKILLKGEATITQLSKIASAMKTSIQYLID